MTAESRHSFEDGTRQLKESKTFGYDAMNRLQEVKSDKKLLQRNTYDAEGLRTEMEENDRLIKFLYDGDKVIAESDVSKGLQRFIRGYGLVSSDCEEARTYYHYASDDLGSITDVIHHDGTVLNHYEYDAFGNFEIKEEQVSNRFGYAGEQYDPATNLYYLRARFFNPVIGRFIQEDTYYGDGLNLYAYCHNNPVGYVDPSGHKVCKRKYQSYKALRDMGLSPSEAKKFMDEIKANNPRNLSSGLKGIFTEGKMDDLMKKAGYDKLPSKVGSNNGFDGLYVKRDANGKIKQVVVGEAKYGQSRLKIHQRANK